MEPFITFLESLKREDNTGIIESLHKGYEVLLEDEAKKEAEKEAKKPIITKKYLLSLTANEQGELDGTKLKSAKKQAKALLLKEGFDTLFKNKDQSNIFTSAVSFLAKLLLQGEKISESHVLYFHDLVADNEKKELFAILQDPEISKDDLDLRIETYNEEKEKAARGNLSDEEFEEYSRVKEIHDFGDGWKWVLLLDRNGQPKSRCSIEAKQMGHCGTASGQEILYSLRKGPKSAVTVAVNRGTNEIAQSKGKANTKVNLQKYGKYMLWFFKSDHVKGINDSGYAPDRNTHVSDFLPIDEDIVKYFEQNKPGMISEKYDRKVLDIKRKLAAGQLNDEQVIELFKKREIELAIVKGILGRKKFYTLVDEKRAIKWIKEGTLTFKDIIQTETKMFTNDVQKELVLQDRSNYKHFKLLEQELDTFKINPSLDVWQVQATRGNSIKELNSEQQLKLITDHAEAMTELLQRIPSAFEYFSGDVRITVVDKMPNIFFNILKTNADILEQINPEHRIQIVNNHKDEFAAVIENDTSVLNYFPLEKRKDIFDAYQNSDKHKDLFKRVFANDRTAIKYFARSTRLDIINTYPELFQEFDPKYIKKIPKGDRIQVIRQHPDAFVKFFTESPATIGLFDKKDRMNIITAEMYREAFTEGFKKDISAIGYFPKPDDQIILFKMFKDSILQAINNDPEELDYFSDDIQEKLQQHFDIAA